MITQKATVIAEANGEVKLAAERQTTCGQCQMRKGCGSGLLTRHVGRRLAHLTLPTRIPMEPGDKVTVSIPEQALLKGAFTLYLLPLIGLFSAALLARSLGAGPGLEAGLGLLGLLGSFYLVSRFLKARAFSIDAQISKD